MPHRKPMRVRLGKRWFTIRESGNLNDFGQCEITQRKDGTVERVIRVATWQNEPDELDTWVHEAMHAIWPDKSEAEVAAASAELARLLWRIGYRRTKETNDS
jgi:hypothetical protein